MDKPTRDPPRTEVRSSEQSLPAESTEAGPARELTQETFTAVLSSREQAGRWEPADEIQVRAILGEVKLDFTRAELPPGGVVEIDARAILGAVMVIVPDGADVEVEGTPIVGSIEHAVRRKGVWERVREWAAGGPDQPPPPPRQEGEPPYFRIDGQAIFGNIRVEGR